MKRLTLVVCLLMVSLASASDLDKHIDALRSPDIAIRLAAHEALVKEGATAVKALNGVYFADIDALLLDLGHASFRVRRKATDQLIKLGERCQPKVQRLLESSKDPEVTFRCETILKKVKGKPSDKGLREAVEVVLDIGLELPENEGFIEFYFANFETHADTLKRSLPKAIALCTKNALLTELLPKLKEDVYVQPVLEAIKTRMPNEAPKIIVDYEELLFERGLDIEPIVKEMQEWQNYSTDDFNKIARRLEAEPLYEKKRPILIEKFLSNPSNKAKALGIRLAKNDIKPFVPLIVAQIKTFESSPHPMFYFFDDVKGKDKHFHPHVQVFLKSKSNDVQLIGIALCSSAPTEHKETVLNVYETTDDYSLAQNSCKFLLEHFPEMRDSLQKQAVKRILDIGAKNDRAINAMSFVLRDHFKYKGNELGDWWAQWSEVEGVHDHHALDVALRVNVPVRVMIPLITRTEQLSAEVAKHLLKGAKENRQLIFNLFKQRMTKRVPHYSSIDKVLLKELPDSYDDIVPKIMDRVSEETEYSSSFHSVLERYSKPIQEKPSRADVIRPYLSHNTMFVRYYAAVILLDAFPDDPASKAILEKLAKSGHKDFQKDLLKDLFAFDVKFETIQPMLRNYLAGVKDGYHQVRFIAENMTPTLARHREFFQMEMRTQAQKGHLMNAILLGQGLLQIDADDKHAIDFLTKQAIEGSSLTHAAQALEVLGKFGRDPELPMKRLEQLYQKCEGVGHVNMALGVSKKNLYRAIPIVTKHLARNFEQSYTELDDLTWEHEEYQKALTPGLVKALASGDLKRSKSALSTLTSGSCALKNHIETLKKVYSKAPNPKFRRSFLWMLANMETDAAPFAAIIPKHFAKLKGKDMSHYLFAMSRISPVKTERRAYTRKFLEHLKTFKKNDAPYRMLRLIKEFSDLTFPILIDLLEKQEDDDRHEAVWGLIREKPFTSKTVKVFELVLKRCQKGQAGYDDVASNLCWALRKRLPQAIEFLPLLKDAKPKLKASEGYHLLMHDIRTHQRQN